MIRRRRSGSAFWLFLLVLALGVGWAAYQEWRWPHLALLDRESESDAQVSAPEVMAEQSAAEQPVTEDSGEASVAETAPESAAEPDETEAQAETMPEAAPAEAEAEAHREPAATEPAAPVEQDLAAKLAAQQPEPEPSVRDTAEPAPEPGPVEAETAAPRADAEPADTSVAVTGAPPSSELETETETAETSVAVTDAPSSSELETETETAEASVAVTDAPPRPETETETEPVETSVAVTGAPSSSELETETEAEPAETETAPRFDIVRVGRDGRAVIAGRAAPGAEVEVRSGGEVIDRVHATRRGEWVAIPARPLAPGDRELSAVASLGGAAVESEQVVVVAVPGPTSPTSPTTAAAEAAVAAEPVAVLLPRDGRGTGRILQAPGRLSAEGTLALMTVSYDESGDVLLSGEAPPGVPVRIYVDNRPAALVVGDAKGDWSSGLGETLAPGTYTLRLDQLGADGQTVARIETPFTRVSEPPIEGDLKVDYVVVQPGNSLWRIARRLSGKGLDYVHIYGVNQTQIRNPDLIYPGQVFQVPRELGSAG